MRVDLVFFPSFRIGDFHITYHLIVIFICFLQLPNPNMRFRKTVPKANFVVTIWDEKTYHIKTNRMTNTDLEVTVGGCQLFFIDSFSQNASRRNVCGDGDVFLLSCPGAETKLPTSYRGVYCGWSLEKW